MLNPKLQKDLKAWLAPVLVKIASQYKNCSYEEAMLAIYIYTSMNSGKNKIRECLEAMQENADALKAHVDGLKQLL